MQLIFGKNIKKIRSIRGLSQQEFADLFDLKRGTLGAYEEGRSNPKLETVIKIANHFSIGIEALLMGELTVNKLLKFNESLTVTPDSVKSVEFEGIPFILSNDKVSFAKYFNSRFDFSKYPKLRFPYIETDNRIAFSVDDLSMTGGIREFFPKDVIIANACKKTEVSDKNLVVALSKGELFFRRIYVDGDTYILKANHYGVEDVVLKGVELEFIWKVEHVFQYNIVSKELMLENRLSHIEQNLAQLKNGKDI